jgi:hypothetical protein
MTGTQQFPFTTLEWLGTASMMAVPTAVTIQAVEPFAFPSAISYRVTRISDPGRKLKQLDLNATAELRSLAGRLIAEGKLAESYTYRLDEVPFNEPKELVRYGKKQSIQSAFRLTLQGADLSRVGLVWVDDVALPAFLSYDRHSTMSMIYDPSVLRDGFQLSVSETDGSQMRLLAEKLQLPASLRTVEKATQEEGNVVVSIKDAVRAIGASRQALVQIELRTNRPFPARPSPLRLQVGKRFFFDELSGDYTGRKLTLTLTPEMFSELKSGADIVAFFDRPDRSGFAGEDVWYFGRLNKGMLEKSAASLAP